MNAFDQWLDETLGGQPMTVENFARSAGLGDIPRIETPVARLTRTDVWPPEVLAEIRRIYGEEEQSA